MACFYTEDDRKGSYQSSPEKFFVNYRISKRTNTATAISKNLINRVDEST